MNQSSYRSLETATSARPLPRTAVRSDSEYAAERDTGYYTASATPQRPRTTAAGDGDAEFVPRSERRPASQRDGLPRTHSADTQSRTHYADAPPPATPASVRRTASALPGSHVRSVVHRLESGPSPLVRPRTRSAVEAAAGLEWSPRHATPLWLTAGSPLKRPSSVPAKPRRNVSGSSRGLSPPRGPATPAQTRSKEGSRAATPARGRPRSKESSLAPSAASSRVLGLPSAASSDRGLLRRPGEALGVPSPRKPRSRGASTQPSRAASGASAGTHGTHRLGGAHSAPEARRVSGSVAAGQPPLRAASAPAEAAPRRRSRVGAVLSVFGFACYSSAQMRREERQRREASQAAAKAAEDARHIARLNGACSVRVSCPQ